MLAIIKQDGQYVTIEALLYETLFEMSVNRVLIVRNDKIGDFVLSLPAIRLLKLSCPDIHISVLINEYTRAIAESVDYIDEIVIDSKVQSTLALYHLLKGLKIDAVVTLFSSFHVALACFLLRTPIRIAPATKLFQFFYNHRVIQRRSQSLKPEFEYNNDLMAYLLSIIRQKPKNILNDAFLTLDQVTKTSLKQEFVSEMALDIDSKVVFIHPGCGGSAKNLNVQQYSELAQGLIEHGLQVVLTAGPGELDLVNQVSCHLAELKHTVYHSQKGLMHFMHLISMADVFIGGSTGPLHIAGAYDVKTVGFYPNRRSATSLRWRTLNSDDHLLSFSPNKENGAEDMASIDMDYVLRTVLYKFKL